MNRKETGLIDSKYSKKTEKNFFATLVILFLTYLALSITELVINIQSIQFGPSKVGVKSFFIAIPLIGLILYLFRKRVAWFINIFYYQFMILVYGSAFTISMRDNESNILYWHNWFFLSYTVLAFLIFSLLCFQYVKRIFGIDRLTFIITIVTGFLLYILIMSFTFF